MSREAEHNAALNSAVEHLGKDWGAFKAAQAAELKAANDRIDTLEARTQDVRATCGTRDADAAKRSNLFRRVLKSGGRDDGVYREYLAAGGGAPEGKGLSEGVSAEGGVMLPRTFSAALAERQRELQPLRQICRVEQTDSAFSEHKAVVQTEHVVGEWVGETSTRNELAAPKFAAPSFPDGATSTIIKISEWLLDDSKFDPERIVRESAAKSFAKMENLAVISGNATNKPRGILNAAPVATLDDASPLRAFGTLQFVPIAPGASPAGVVTADGILDLVHSLRVPYWRGASFIMSRATAAKVRKLKDADLRYLWEPNYQAGQPPMLLGFPCYLVDEMASVALNAIPILFGDFVAGYTILEKELRVTIDNVTSPGFVKLHVRRRVSGAVTDDYAIKAGKCVAA